MLILVCCAQCLFDNKRRNTVMLTGKVMSDITLNKFTSGRIKASLSLGVDAHRCVSFF